MISKYDDAKKAIKRFDNLTEDDDEIMKELLQIFGVLY